MLAAALLVAAVALLSALPRPRPLGAQQPTRPASRDTTRVDTVRVQRLAPQVVTGARLSAASSVRVPGRADAVAVRAIESSNPAPVARALARLPGVSLSDDQGSRAQPTLDVRGFEASPVVGVAQGVSVFLDGVRINEADAQEVHFDLIPAEAVDRAELVRGPGALFGKNSLAGALLLS